MAAYDAAAKSARTLLTKKGTTITVERRSAGTIDPVTQVATGASSTEYSFKGLGLPPGKSAEYQIGSLAGRMIEEFHFAQRGQTINPGPGDIVRGWKGADWTIFWSLTYDPTGDGAIYTKAYAER